MKKLNIVAVLAALVAAPGAFAQASAPAPDYTLSFNVGAVSDYRYRGISQSRKDPAIQGGVDFAHSSGFYVGTWASSIKWIEDGGGNAEAEVDIYGGYKGTVGAFGYDVGVLRYIYPRSELPVNPNTTEVYVAGTFGPATLKYSHAVTNLFGFDDSKNSYYVDLSATFPLGVWDLTLTPHVGYQKVKNYSDFTYTDYSLTLGKDFGNGLAASVAVIDTDNNNYRGPGGQNLGKATVVLGVKYTF